MHFDHLREFRDRDTIRAGSAIEVDSLIVRTPLTRQRLGTYKVIF